MGRITDYVTGERVERTPTEETAQRVARELVERHGWERTQLRRDWFLRTRVVNAYGEWENFHRKVQVAVVADPSADGDAANVVRICVVKPRGVRPDDEREGIWLLEEVLGALPSCDYGLWTNGRETACRRKNVEGRIEPEYIPIDDLPGRDGQPPTEPARPRRARRKRPAPRAAKPRPPKGLYERLMAWLDGLWREPGSGKKGAR